MSASGLRLAGPALLLTSALVALLLGLVIGGGADPRVTSDPGAVVRWGLPVAKLIVNLGAAVMVGSAVLAAYALTQGEKEFDTALDVASIGAAVLTIGAGVTGYLTFLSSFNPEVSLGPGFGQQFGRFLLETELGRVWLITTVMAAILTVISYAFRGWAAALLLTFLSLASLVPMATQGHSGSLANHDAAVISLVLHITSAAVWLGGLLALVFLRPSAREHRLRAIVERYSTIALVAFVVVSVSGVARAMTSVSGWRELLSAYGAVLLVKVVALTLLGVVGVAHRQWYIRRGVGERAPFWTFVTVEFAVMGIASGAAAALARTPAPADTSAPALTTPAEILTEAPLPPELTLVRWLSGNDVNPLWVMVAGFGVFFYLMGVRRLRRRGEAWSGLRTFAWISGMVLLAWVNSGAVAVYSDYLHSVDAAGRMLMLLVVPSLLVFGAPYRLALEGITNRTDGSRGIREWLRAGERSRIVLVLRHPIVAMCTFAFIVWGVSATGLLRDSLADPLVHELRVVALLVAGSLVTAAILRPAGTYPRRMRVVVVFGSAAALASVGSWVLLQSGLIAASWFGAMGRQWGLEPMADQQAAGMVILLSAPMLLLFGLSVDYILSGHSTRSPQEVDRPLHSTRKAIS